VPCTPRHRGSIRPDACLAAGGAALRLAACGGGGIVASSRSSRIGPDAVVLQVGASRSTAPASLPTAAAPRLQPTFHVTPVVLDAPSDADADDHRTSALALPHQQSLPPAQAVLATRGLTLQPPQSARRAPALAAVSGQAGQAPSASFGVADPGGCAMTLGISGLPPGMSFALSGGTLRMNWAKPVQGGDKRVMTAKDSLGLSTRVAVPVTIAKAG